MRFPVKMRRLHVRDFPLGANKMILNLFNQKKHLSSAFIQSANII